MNWNINIDLVGLFKKQWQNICYWTVAILILLFGVLLFPTQSVELRASLMTFTLPIVGGAIYFRKSLLAKDRPTPTKRLIIIIITMGGIALLTYITGYFIAYNMFNQGGNERIQSLAKIALVLYVVSAITLLALLYVLAKNADKLPLFIIGGYFAIGGLVGSICCGISKIADTINVDRQFYDIYQEQLVTSLMHIISGVGIALVVCGVIVVLEKFLISDKAT